MDSRKRKAKSDFNDCSAIREDIGSNVCMSVCESIEGQGELDGKHD